MCKNLYIKFIKNKKVFIMKLIFYTCKRYIKIEMVCYKNIVRKVFLITTKMYMVRSDFTSESIAKILIVKYVNTDQKETY